MIPPRIPEGGAILDMPRMSMDEYSEWMYKSRKNEYMQFAKQMLDGAAPPKNAHLLEIGPGPSWITIFVAQLRPDLHITGLEASIDMVRVGKANVAKFGLSDRIEYVEGVVENLQTLKGARFDCVFSHDSLHHWEKLEIAFAEIMNVLAPNGKIFIQDSRRDLNFGGKLIHYGLGKFISGKMWKYWHSSIMASYTPQELNSMFDQIKLPWKVDTGLLDLTIMN